MSDVPYRELYWWEHYPLHKWWCNDICPIVPRFKYTNGNEYNTNNWYLHWLIFHIWTLDHVIIGADVEVSLNNLYVGFLLPYIRIRVGISHYYTKWTYKLDQLISRKPAKTLDWS